MPKTWRYQVAHCRYDDRGSGREGHWVLEFDREYPLLEGLNHLGSLGYELVGIQTAEMEAGGVEGFDYKPRSIYIFKQPVEA